MSFQKANDFISLTKPRLSLLVVFTCGAGVLLAPASIDVFSLLLLLLGTTFVVGAANALNCYLEVDVDALMERTQQRPTVQGRLPHKQVLLFGMLLALLGCCLLAWGTNYLTAFLGLLGFALYVGVYTPMKRWSRWSLFAGAIPGALPPMMGWTGVTNSMDAGAWVLFAILFFWQIPHFLAIALAYQKQYDRAGLKTYPSALGVQRTEKIMVAYSAFLVLITFLPYSLEMAGVYYLSIAILLGFVFMSLCVLNMLKEKKWQWSRAIFIGSLIYLPIVLGTWILDLYILRS